MTYDISINDFSTYKLYKELKEIYESYKKKEDEVSSIEDKIYWAYKALWIKEQIEILGRRI